MPGFGALAGSVRAAPMASAVCFLKLIQVNARLDCRRRLNHLEAACTASSLASEERQCDPL
jgi:hypothetical protein